jgi:ribosomal protein S18 acetylase RimI-like enzyme
MTRRDELVDLAHESFVTSFEKLAGHSEGGGHRWFGGVFAHVTGLPISLFNGCVVVGEAAAEDLAEALRWVAGHGVPMRLFVVEDFEGELGAVARAQGLERNPVPYPGMVLSPIPDIPAPQEGVAVERVDETRIDEFRGVFVADGGTRDLAERLFSDRFLVDADVTPFVGYLEGRPVGYSLALRSAGTIGVYNVGTLPEARRRGVGTALTWAAVDVARRVGLDCAVLQSSEMAVGMYEAMGFRTLVRYVDFRAPVTPIGQETPVPPSPQ